MSKSFAEYKEFLDSRLNSFFQVPEEEDLHGYAEAARYSLLAGGKRIRGILLMEFCRIAGGKMDTAADAACAVEMLHAYSLIHDDLPCMDNDTLRRGKPTNHVVFGECVATLAGDVLQTEAFGTILRSKMTDSARLRCATLLAEASGFYGMCGGQYLDMRGEGAALDTKQLDRINSLKTGALLSASCAMGVAAADGTKEQENAAAAFGSAIGLAFQIRDDILDVISSEEELGKPIGSDQQENKNTYMALLGQERCEDMIHELTGKAKMILRKHFSDTIFLENMADSLAVRNK